MHKIPFRRQLNMHFCAPAIMQMILETYGLKLSQHMIAKEMKTPRTLHEGTKTKQVVIAIKKYGLKVQAGNNKTIRDIKTALKKDKIVVVCYTEPIMEWGHYAIVRKFLGNRVVLIDPDSRTGRTSLLTNEFKRRWQDPLFTKSVRWAAMVEPPKKPLVKK